MRIIHVVFYLFYSCTCFCADGYIFDFSDMPFGRVLNLDSMGTGIGKISMIGKLDDNKIMKAANDVLGILGFDSASMSKEGEEVVPYTVSKVRLETGEGKKHDVNKIVGVCLKENQLRYLESKGLLKGLNCATKHAEGNEQDFAVVYTTLAEVYRPFLRCFASIKYWHVVNVARCISDSFYLYRKPVSVEQIAVLVSGVSFLYVLGGMGVNGMLFKKHFFKKANKDESGDEFDYMKDVWSFIVCFLINFSKQEVLEQAKLEDHMDLADIKVKNGFISAREIIRRILEPSGSEDTLSEDTLLEGTWSRKSTLELFQKVFKCCYAIPLHSKELRVEAIIADTSLALLNLQFNKFCFKEGIIDNHEVELASITPAFGSLGEKDAVLFCVENKLLSEDEKELLRRNAEKAGKIKEKVKEMEKMEKMEKRKE